MRDSRAHVEASGRRPEGRLRSSCPSPPPRPSTGSVASISSACSAATATAASRPSSRARAGRAPAPGGRRTQVRERIVALRTELTARGLDAGPVTIAWHLGREGLPVPSTSTIRRILHAAGLVVPEPRKRPRSSWIRFEAAAPNELWQSDVTHWRLADGTEVEICSLARRPLALPARLHGLRAGRRATTSWPRSRPPARSTAGPPPRSPTTAPSTRRASPAVATASSTCSPTSASARRTGRPAIPRPRARSSASTRP